MSEEELQDPPIHLHRVPRPMRPSKRLAHQQATMVGRAPKAPTMQAAPWERDSASGAGGSSQTDS